MRCIIFFSAFAGQETGKIGSQLVISWSRCTANLETCQYVGTASGTDRIASLLLCQYTSTILPLHKLWCSRLAIALERKGRIPEIKSEACDKQEYIRLYMHYCCRRCVQRTEEGRDSDRDVSNRNNAPKEKQAKLQAVFFFLNSGRGQLFIF